MTIHIKFIRKLWNF